ncbi:SsrA-binding protein [Dokdonia sp. R78006]
MQTLYKFLAKVNKAVLPSYSKRGLDLTQASKIQLAIFGYRIWVTIRALD